MNKTAAREASRYPIPDDWDEELDGFLCYLICVPNSRKWRGVFDGHISSLAYGRKWNRNSGIIKEAQVVAREIFESMCAVKCDDLLNAIQCICDAVTILAENSDKDDQGQDAESSDGEVEVGPGTPWADQDAYFDAKCNVSNGCFDTVLGTVVWLDDNLAELIGGVFGGVTSGLLLAFQESGPIGWAISKVELSVASIASYILRFAVGFIELENALNEQHDECVLALFNASDTLSARSNFLAALGGATVPPGIVDLEFVEFVLTAEMLNQLFDPRADMATYQSPDAVDCGTGLLVIWDFANDFQSWTFSDESEPGGLAVRTYNATTEAIATQLTSVEDRSRGLHISPTISQAVGVGNSVQMDYSQSSDGQNWGKTIQVFFTDATSILVTRTGDAGPSTLILDMEASKTIERVEVTMERGDSEPARKNYDIDVQILEVRIQ